MKKLLLVEDDLLILDDLQSLINWENAGYQVLTAVNGKQGVQKYIRHRPELVITDVKMPLMDGLEMMQTIHEMNPYVRFMILSAYEDYAYLREAIQLGASDYIRKPSITPELLLEKVEHLRESWEANAVSAWVQLKGSFRELYENMDRSPEDISEAVASMRELCGCFIAEDMLHPFQSYAEKTLGCELGDSADAFFARLEQALAPVQYSNSVFCAVRYIEQNFTNPTLSNADVAKHVGLSDKRLSVKFKEETGQTLNEYITMIRMDKAKELLAAGMMVYEVADRAGYSSPQYFSSAFKNYTGVTPNEFRGGAGK